MTGAVSVALNRHELSFVAWGSSPRMQGTRSKRICQQSQACHKPIFLLAAKAEQKKPRAQNQSMAGAVYFTLVHA